MNEEGIQTSTMRNLIVRCSNVPKIRKRTHKGMLPFQKNTMK